MEFLKPAWLWGILTLALPVIIHFWYQKRGQTIWWAAIDWLGEKTSLKHRGLRLHEIPLMLLRCLLLLLLVLILSQPLLDFFERNDKPHPIHLVEANPMLIENFRFEIENALSKGEKVFLTGSEVSELKSFDIRPDGDNNDIFLQKNIQSVSKKGTELHLYLSNSYALTSLPRIYIPVKYHIHYHELTNKNYDVSFLNIGNRNGLYVDDASGLLTVRPEAEIVASHPRAMSAHNGKLKVLVEVRDMEARKTVEAALASLVDVYQLPFEIRKGKYQVGSIFDLVISDHDPKTYYDQTLYVITGSSSVENVEPNVIYMNDSLKIATSEMVRNGRLPEWLGEQIVRHYGLDKRLRPVSTRELKSSFSLADPQDFKAATISKWLVSVFLLALFLERAIVFRKEREND